MAAMVLIGFVTMFEDTASVANNRINDQIVLDNNPIIVSPLPLPSPPAATPAIVIPEASPAAAPETVNQDASPPVIVPPAAPPNNPLNSVGGNGTNPSP